MLGNKFKNFGNSLGTLKNSMQTSLEHFGKCDENTFGTPKFKKIKII
jgi:hypothetical protein